MHDVGAERPRRRNAEGAAEKPYRVNRILERTLQNSGVFVSPPSALGTAP